jgi:hypothetical protein
MISSIFAISVSLDVVYSTQSVGIGSSSGSSLLVPVVVSSTKDSTGMGLEERQAVPMSQARPRESSEFLSKASHKDILGIPTPTKLTSSGPKSGGEQRVVPRNILTSITIVVELGLDRVAPTTPVTTTASSETEMGTDLDNIPRAVPT